MGRIKISIIVLFVSIFAIYLGLLFSYFQQDEWYGYGWYILYKDAGTFGLLEYFFLPSLTHFTPFNLMVVHYSYALFDLHFEWHAVISIALHLLNGLVVYFVSYRLLLSKKKAMFSSLMFLSFASTHQATTWVVANLATHLSTMLGLLSFYFVLLHLDHPRMWRLVLSVLFLITSLLFKEITIGLLVLIPLFVIARGRESSKKTAGIFVIVMLTYLTVRGLMYFAPVKLDTSTAFASQTFSKLIYNFVTIPLKSLPQSIFPHQFLTGSANTVARIIPEKISGVEGTPEYEVFVTKRVLEVLSLGLAFVLVYIFGVRGVKQSRRLTLNAFLVLWVIINSFIFAFAPERTGVVFLIDSRNLYFVSVGVAILIANTAHLRKGRHLGVAALVLFIVFQQFYLGKEVVGLINQGRVRREILSEIMTKYPDLPQRVLVYIQSDSSYYGLAENVRIVPFQSGFGQTLLASYYAQERYPKEFYKERFLWDIASEGYKEVDGRGFGYFRDFLNMARVVQESNIPESGILGFRWSSDEGELVDISNEVRGRLEGYLVESQLISSIAYTVTSTANNVDIENISDGRRDTFWNSGLPYGKSQAILVDFNGGRRVSSLSIDSFTNRDQGSVGYAIYAQDDSGSWSRPYYSARVSKEDGVSWIYIEPQNIFRLAILQIGAHEHANWVVHELNIYEETN